MSHSIKSAERVLKLFEHFAAAQQPATIKQLSEALSMPQSSTSMLVRNLVTLGYLEHRPQDRSYFPTLRLPLLGDWMTSGLNLRTPFFGHSERYFFTICACAGSGLVALHEYQKWHYAPAYPHLDRIVLFIAPA